MSLKRRVLTQLSALTGRLQQQPQLIQDQGHVHGVAAQPLHTEQERHGCLKLSRQEQHLEVQEGVLDRCEVGLTCQRDVWRKSGVRGKEKESKAGRLNLSSTLRHSFNELIDTCSFVCKAKPYSSTEGDNRCLV